MPKGGLTEKQRRFVSEYLIDLNATAAARRAGYSEKTADRIGPELLGKSWVADEIRKGQERREKRTEVAQDDVVRELQKIAFSEAADYTDSGLKFSNKLKALELLGKHLGMFTERIALSKVDDAVIQDVEKLIHDAAGRG